MSVSTITVKRSTAALRKAIIRLSPGNRTPVGVGQSLSNDFDRWGLSEEEDTFQPQLQAQQPRRRQPRQKSYLDNIVHQANSIAVGISNNEDAPARQLAEQQYKSLIKFVSDCHPRSVDRNFFTAAVVARAVAEQSRLGEDEIAKQLVNVSKEHLNPEAVSIVVTRAVECLVDRARVMSAFQLLIGDVEADMPIKTHAFAKLAHGFVKWGSKMESQFCRVALAEHIEHYHMLSGNTPTRALSNAVLSLAAQADNRSRFFIYAFGKSSQYPSGSSHVSGSLHNDKDLVISDDLNDSANASDDFGLVGSMLQSPDARLRPNGDTICILLRAARTISELRLVASNLFATSKQPRHNILLKRRISNSIWHPASPPNHSLFRRNTKAALEYIRALLRCNHAAEVGVKDLYSLIFVCMSFT